LPRSPDPVDAAAGRPAAASFVLPSVSIKDLDIQEALRARGGGVYRCVTPAGERYALKVIDTAATERKADITRDRARALHHEIEVLRKLPEAVGDLYVESGELGSVIWLLTRWVDGEPASEMAKPLRDRPFTLDTQSMWLSLLLAIAEAVAGFHCRGYVHGDLQPVHCISGADGRVRLLDFELTHRPGDQDIEFRGGLVHFNAPEVALGMVQRFERVPFDVPAEVYTLGSVLFFLFTGQTSTGYGTLDYKSVPMDAKLEMIGRGDRNSFREAGAPEFPELELILNECMARDPGDRLSDAEAVAERLRAIR